MRCAQPLCLTHPIEERPADQRQAVEGAVGQAAEQLQCLIILAEQSELTSQMVQVAKSLQQQGFPSDHLSLASNALDMKNVFKPAGSALNDVYASDEWTGWGLDTSDADTYRKWTASLPNPLSGNVVQGWMYMMWLYTAAKHIGFGSFSSSTLTHWLQNSANGTPIPMSRTYINPGPTGKQAIKQPYVQILHWDNGKMSIVTQGTDNGWVTPYTS